MNKNRKKSVKPIRGSYSGVRQILKLAMALGQSGGGMTVDEMAGFLECSTRTAQRYKGALEEIFGPTSLECLDETEHPQRWKMQSQDLPELNFIQTDDIQLMRNAAKMMQDKNMTVESDRLELLAGKLLEKLAPAKRRAAAPDLEALTVAEGLACRPGVRQKIAPQILENLRLAIKGCLVVKVVYFNKKSGKTNENELEPYGILYGDRTQYLLARHRDGYFGDEIHQFLLSNIKSVALTNQSFDSAGFNIREYVKDSFGIYREKPYTVEWRFSARAADEADKYIFHPNQKKQHNPDGTLTVTFKAGGTLEMAWHLYTWGKEVKVVKPRNFWKRVELAEQNRWG